MPKGKLVVQSVIEQHLKDYDSSKESMASYCRNHTIPISTFRGWQKRYGESQKQGRSLTRQDFIPLPVSSRGSGSSRSGVIKLTQTMVELSGEVPHSLLESFVSAIQSNGVFKC